MAYLDDFLFVGASAPRCGALLDTFKGVCNSLGVEEDHKSKSIHTFSGLGN